jgi:hypothetical protein
MGLKKLPAQPAEGQSAQVGANSGHGFAHGEISVASLMTDQGGRAASALSPSGPGLWPFH